MTSVHYNLQLQFQFMFTLMIRIMHFYGSLDTSKSIYLNATLEKLALVRLLKEREMRLATFMDDWADNLSVRHIFLFDDFCLCLVC